MFQIIGFPLLPQMPWFFVGLSWLVLVVGSLSFRRNSLFFPLTLIIGAFLFGMPFWIGIPLIVLSVLVYVPFVRRNVAMKPILAFVEKNGLMPKISSTERIALDAGSTWVETELFCGKPNFDRIAENEMGVLTASEQAFLDGPVEELCSLVDPYKLREQKEIPTEVWEFMCQKNMFAVGIPQKFGGLGFSSTLFTAMVAKIASRSGGLAITAMVPNTVGPAELLLHHGTEEQKNYYLPRLAKAQEIPCFALTEVEAGSDAGAVQSSGEVFMGADGVLMARLNFKKRYISLASIATLLGVAVRLRDPKNLLGKGPEVGITSFLVPNKTPGVVQGMRHDALGSGYPVGPLEGVDVEVPLSAIIGGPSNAGQGWRMLIDALAAGRGLSLPAYAAGQAKFSARVAGAYAGIRRQFGVSIGSFEGVEEPLARIAGTAYALDAVRKWNAEAVDRGFKSAVVSAISKQLSTELLRKSLDCAMDVFGGRGICMGQRNPIAAHYIEKAIPITVEGANILTRTMMIFGQGAFRCHPYAYAEVRALERKDVVSFDKALTGHLWYLVGNITRTLLLSVTRGYSALGLLKKRNAPIYRKLSRASAAFSVLADVAMFSYGGKLKQAEKVCGRLADIFSWSYFIMATLRSYEDNGCKTEERPLLQWVCDQGFSEMDAAFQGLYQNMKVPGLTWFLKRVVAPLARMNPLSRGITDEVSSSAAKVILTYNQTRAELVYGSFVANSSIDAASRIEKAFVANSQCESMWSRVTAARLSGQIKRLPLRESIFAAKTAGIISENEAQTLQKAFDLYWDALQVDAVLGAPRESSVREGATARNYQSSFRLEEVQV